jgi:hypothetical protein
MEQYISKSALVAGIKKLHGNPFYRMAIKDVLSILDTLDVKEMDLNEEFDKYFFNFVDPDTGEKLKRTECWLNIRQARKFAKHFFELGMAVSNKAQKGK